MNLIESNFIYGHVFGFLSGNIDYCLTLDAPPSFLVRLPVAVLGGREGGRLGGRTTMI